MLSLSWKNARRAMVVLSMVAVMGFGTLAAAQDGALSRRVDLFLVEGNLEDALNLLTKQTGLEFVIEPGDKQFAKINLSLKDKTAYDAIRFICEAAGAWADKDAASGVYIIRRGAKPIGGNTIAEPKVKEPVVVRKIRLKHGDPETIWRQIKGEIIDPLKEYRELTKLRDMGAPKLQSMNEMFVTGMGMNPGAAYPVSTKMTPAELQRNESLRETGADIALPGEDANQAGFGGGVGGGQQGGNNGGRGQGNGQGGGGGQTITSGQGFAPEGIQQVTYDPVDNAIVVQGTDEAIRELRNLIDMFDVAPRQVIIKVEFVETSQGVTRSLGFDWLYQRGAMSVGNRPGSMVRAGDPIFINYATGNITTRMRTSILESNGRTVQAPLIRTLNNQPASVSQSASVAIFRTTTTVSNGTVIQTPQVTQIQTNTGISVRPRINDDGTVTMFLQPQVQGFGQIRRDSQGNEFPDLISQSISVVARVKDRETIALGGLTNKNTQETVARFPILSELPIIGSFFKQTNKQRSDTETIIFVTPMIVQDDENGGLTP